jgi:hypothetical protein
MLRGRWCFLLLFVSTSAVAQATPSAVGLDIRADSAALEAAAAEYRSIWGQDGARIVATMQRISGLQFRESSIPVRIVTGPSSSGYRARPMRLRGSYPEPTKRATLIHELGHRLQNELFARGEDDHPALFLWLYDVWTALYGAEFARQQVDVESARTGGRHDYRAMWAQAQSMDSSARANAWRRLRTDRQQDD